MDLSQKAAHSGSTIRTMGHIIIIIVFCARKLRSISCFFFKSAFLDFGAFFRLTSFSGAVSFDTAPSKCYRCSRFLIHAYSHLLLASDQVAVLISINQNSIALQTAHRKYQFCHPGQQRDWISLFREDEHHNRIQTIKSQWLLCSLKKALLTMRSLAITANILELNIHNTFNVLRPKAEDYRHRYGFRTQGGRTQRPHNLLSPDSSLKPSAPALRTASPALSW